MNIILTLFLISAVVAAIFVFVTSDREPFTGSPGDGVPDSDNGPDYGDEGHQPRPLPTEESIS